MSKETAGESSEDEFAAEASHKLLKGAARAKQKAKQFKSQMGEYFEGMIADKKQEIELASDDSFAESEPEEGDQFMSCKPWLGAIKKPTTGPLEENAEPPECSYEIEFVHGYKSDQARQNLFYTPSCQMVYMTAALGVVLDPVNRTQKFFGGGEEKVQ